MKKYFTLLGALTVAGVLVLSSCGHNPQQPVTPVIEDEKEPEFADYVYLSDLQPSKVVSGSDKHNFLGVDAGLTETGGTHQLALLTDKENNIATVYQKGITLHAGKDAQVVYNITNMGATRLTGIFGINANVNDTSSAAKLRIVVDNETLYESPKALTPLDLAVNVDTTLPAGAKELTIMMIDDGNHADSHAIFANPRLYANYYDLDAYEINQDTVTDYRGVHHNSTPSAQLKLATVYKANFNNKNYYSINRRFQHGFGLHTFDKGEAGEDKGESSYTINLPNVGTANRRFTAFFGNSSDQSTDSNPKLKFEVIENATSSFAKEKNLKDPAINNAESDSFIDIALKPDTTSLTFKTSGADEKGKSGSSCHPVLVMPRVYVPNFDLTQPYQFDLNTASPYLKPGESLNYQALYKDYKGNVHDISNDGDLKISLADTSTSFIISGHKIIASDTKGSSEIKFEYQGVNETVGKLTNDSGLERTSLVSPDSSNTITVELVNGVPYYSITHGQEAIVRASPLGFKAMVNGTDAETFEFTKGLSLQSKTTAQHIHETYPMVSGKYSEYINDYNTQDVTFKNAKGKYITIELRAYNDGCAFRYSFGDGVTAFMFNNSEATEMHLDPNSLLYFQQSRNFHKYSGSHEEIYYVERNPAPYPDWDGTYDDSGTKPQESGGMSVPAGIQINGMLMPFLFKTVNNTSVVMSEAGLDGSYAGSMVNRITSTDNCSVYKVNVPPQDYYTYMNQASGCKRAHYNFTSPWRAFVIGTEKTMVETTMIENLAPAQDMTTDFSWVKPGVTSWSWMSGVNTSPDAQEYQGREDVIRNQIDLAARMGWKYYILDEGWPNRVTTEEAIQRGYVSEYADHFPGKFPIPGPEGFRDYTPEVMAYAKSKGIGLIAWIHVGQFNDPTNNYEQMEKLISSLKDVGFVGVKADFFDSESQFTIDLENRLYECLLKHKMIANLHGANKPTGERRHYQNVINREGVWGEETNHIYTENSACQVYIRALTGPTDFTPYIYPASRSDTTMGQQLAYPVAFESGLTCFASSIEEFDGLDDNLKDYYYAYPTVWANTRYLSGNVNEGLTVARESRDGRYYVGGFNSYGKSEVIKLDFLDPNKTYEAKIYTDGANTRSVHYNTVKVRYGEGISVHMNHNGGFAIKLTPVHNDSIQNAQLAFLN